jgi:AraC family transcriptional regulator, regulatory protein of adaptative response / DNA-3-methyladenine glycosylase II
MAVSTYKSEDHKVALNFSSGMPAELADALARGRLRKTATNDVSGLDPAICWQAMQSRDRRFDGRFFAGVLTTRVYCRPICPVPLRNPENVRWFPSAASAEAAGYRPCLRCRPHTSPGTPAWLGTSSVVSRALKLIFQGALDSGDVEGLAGRVGMGARHLRRLFLQHLGASPARVARTRRIHFARSLIEETELSITKIALYSGFRSIRQFNHAIRAAFGQPPTELRRNNETPRPRRHGGEIVLFASYRPPFNWAELIDYLKRRATPGVELVDASRYRRTIEINGEPGEIEVRQDHAEPRLRVQVKLPNHEHLFQVIERVRRIFDLGADPLQIANHLSHSRRLKPFVEARPGLRVPGVWDGFEFCVLTILDMQLTVGDPRTVARHLVRTFGTPMKGSVAGLNYLFPRPDQLAEADLSVVGIRGACGKAVRSLAQALLKKELTFETSRSLDDALARLSVVRGLGERDCHYIAMRVFGEPDAFPIYDHSLRRAVSTKPHAVSPAELERLSEPWRPWRAYAAMHLWLANAATVASSSLSQEAAR